PVPTPATRSRPHHAVRWAIIVVAAVCFVGLTLYWIEMGKRIYRFQQAQKPAASAENVEAREVASQPVKISSNSMTHADLQKRGKDFRLRHWLQEYKEHGGRNPAWDREALELIESWIA